MNLFIIFLTGLTTGGLSCLAMQGGLLASVIANQKEDEKNEFIKKNRPDTAWNSFNQLDWLPVTLFLVAKLITHVLAGFLLGWLGSKITLSLEIRLFFQTFTALFMFGTAMNLLNVHPIFRYLAFQPPAFLNRYIRKSSKSKHFFAPIVLGVLTIFIPCGITQAMEVLAINSGSPIMGALIMFAFVLGTSPLFAFLGVATAKLSESWSKKFGQVAAATLIGMALYSINGVLLVLNSPLTFQSITRPITYFFSDERFADSAKNTATTTGVPIVDGMQQVTIQIRNEGYFPKKITVQNGVPVQLTLQSNETYSCALAFVFKEFGINTFLDATDTRTFTFTPQKPGRYTFTCSMGMYSGVMEVI